MSEPPEQEEEPEDPAAAADLEELLDQFREPEEALRRRANPLWFIAAILLSVLACWLALRASGGSAEEKPEAAARAGFERHNPQGRLVQPADVAAMVAWLCSDAAAAVNGQALAVDGGETM